MELASGPRPSIIHQRPVVLRPQLSDVRENEQSSYQIGGSRPMSTLAQQQTQQQQQQQQQQQAAQAPTIDFKLNVKIEINSGKCVLHANKLNGITGHSGPAGGQQPGGYFVPGGGGGGGGSSSRLGPQGQASPLNSSYYAYMNEFSMRGGGGGVPGAASMPHAMVVEQEMRNTNFIFPAIGVKAFYESTHKRADHPSRLAKKANLYAMIKLESFAMPSNISLSSYHMINRDMFNSRDMCISPALLDFLEQTLEPFDTLLKAAQAAQSGGVTTNTASMINTSGTSGGQHSMARLGLSKERNESKRASSLLEDDDDDDGDRTELDQTIQFSHDSNQDQNNPFEENSSLGFGEGRRGGEEDGGGDDDDDDDDESSDDQQQQSEQQQVVQIQQEPVYFPVDVVVFVSMLPSSIRFTCQPQSTMECLLKLPSLELVFSTNRIDSNAQAKLESLFSGATDDDERFMMSAGTTANFNSSEGGLNVTCSMTDFSLKFYNRLAIRNPFDMRFFYSEQMMSYSEEKDSLSVRVAYIKVNISRTRRVLTRTSITNGGVNGGTASSTTGAGGGRGGASEQQPPLFAQSDLLDGGELSSSTNRSSLNDVKLSVIADIGTTSFVYDMRNIKEVFVFPKIWYRRSLARRVFLGEESSTTGTTTAAAAAATAAPTSLLNQPKSEPAPTKSDSKNSFLNDQAARRRGAGATGAATMQQVNEVASTGAVQQINPNFKTLVLVSVNLAGFEIKMNMGSVMGNVHLFTRNARALSKLTISRAGPKDLKFNFSIDSTRLIAEGGSNGCLLRIQDITAAIEVNEKGKLSGECPSHKLDFGIYAAECRIDSAYNQASPILAFRLSSLNLKLSDNWESPTPTSVLTLVPSSGDATGSSSANLNADKQGGGGATRGVPEALMELNMTWDQLHLMITRSTTPDLIILFYRLREFLDKQFTESKDYIKECELDLFYEMKVKQQFIEKKETLLKKNFNVNGGNFQLKGNNLTVITFHGNSFSAIKWAVFSLNEPSLDFASQTHPKGDGMLPCNQQNLLFCLGRSQRKRDMASIYMVFRDTTSIFTKYQTISEWFEYAHSSIDAVGLRDFPRFASDEPMMHLMGSQAVSAAKKSKVNDQTRWEEIFHLPSLQIFYDTTQEDNTLKFEFRTEFHDHIQMTFRTELFGFLHELITNYVKETDLTRSKEPNIPSSKKDERNYECVKWELEPTLRLISKFGSSVEPLGVDALLKNLGFHHARSTIPKWLQRGLLDNLNEIMDGVIKLYVKMLADFDPSSNSASSSSN